jgi:hypothetical protein
MKLGFCFFYALRLVVSKIFYNLAAIKITRMNTYKIAHKGIIIENIPFDMLIVQLQMQGLSVSLPQENEYLSKRNAVEFIEQMLKTIHRTIGDRMLSGSVSKEDLSELEALNLVMNMIKSSSESGI